MKAVLITGGTGFIGQALCYALLNEGYVIHVLTRNPKQPHLLRDTNIHYFVNLDDCQVTSLFAMINLAGESLAQGRWSTKKKKRLVSSRQGTTNRVINWLRNNDIHPEVIISGSAIGWYGEHDDEPLTEESHAHEGFNHMLCQQWELAALQAKDLGSRVVLLRIGIVLGSGGALAAMLPAYKLGLGGALGSGNQYWSWIHRDDLIRMIQVIMKETALSGPINATAPNPVRQRIFSKALGKIVNRPTILPMPSILARLLLGEFATEVLLQGQRVLPNKMLEQGFSFNYPTITEALTYTLKNNETTKNGTT